MKKRKEREFTPVYPKPERKRRKGKKLSSSLQSQHILQITQEPENKIEKKERKNLIPNSLYPKPPEKKRKKGKKIIEFTPISRHQITHETENQGKKKKN